MNYLPGEHVDPHRQHEPAEPFLQPMTVDELVEPGAEENSGNAESRENEEERPIDRHSALDIPGKSDQRLHRDYEKRRADGEFHLQPGEKHKCGDDQESAARPDQAR